MGRRLDGGQIDIVDRRKGDFFTQLDTFLRINHVNLQVLFDASNDDKSGLLDQQEMARLVHHILPHATPAETNYFQLQLEASDQREMAYQPFVTFLKNTQTAGAAAERPETSIELGAVLRKMREGMQRNPGGAERVFAAQDTTRRKYLEGQPMLRFVRDAVPGTQQEDVCYLLAYLHARDVERNGQVTLAEFKHAVGAVNPRIQQSIGVRLP